jgi:RimJ/RimL family protein N-acetyltransferase
LIVFNNPTHGAAIAAHAGVTFNPASDTCIAVVRKGEMTGGTIYSNYTHASIAMHVAGFTPSWASIDMLWVAFHYPFVQLRCKKVFAQIPENNLKALEFDFKLGFKEEARIRDVFPAGDLILLSMYRDECRWLKIKPRSLKEPD